MQNSTCRVRSGDPLLRFTLSLPRGLSFLSIRLQGISLRRAAGQRTLSTTVAQQAYIAHSPIPTFKFQDSLPRLPIPTLEETCKKFVSAVVLVRRPSVFDAQNVLPEFVLAVQDAPALIRSSICFTPHSLQICVLY